MDERFVAIIVSAIIAIIFALIYQSIEDAFFTVKYDEENDEDDTVEYEFIDEDLYPGCFVYDTITGEIVQYTGVHLGEDNNNYATCVSMKDNTVRYYYCLFETILHVRQK